MSAKAISEQTGKELLYKFICTTSAIQNRFKYARVTPDTDWARLLQDHPWLLSQVSPPSPGPSSGPRVRGIETVGLVEMSHRVTRWQTAHISGQRAVG